MTKSERLKLAEILDTFEECRMDYDTGKRLVQELLNRVGDDNPKWDKLFDLQVKRVREYHDYLPSVREDAINALVEYRVCVDAMEAEHFVLRDLTALIMYLRK